MEEMTNLISNQGFPIAMVIGGGYGIVQFAKMYIKSTNERENKLMDNNKAILEVVQNVVVTLEKLNEKIDTVLGLKNNDKEK